MKKAILLFTFLLFSLQIVAQSKKEIIETLKIRIDSLHSEIKNRDINFEKAQALANSNKEALQLTISKLEQDIAFLKGQLDVTQKTNDKLVENNTQLTIRVAELKDSISFIQQNIEAQEAQPIYSDFDRKVKAAFDSVNNYEYTNNVFDNISVENDIIKDSFNQSCNDDGCISYVLTDQFLVMSYRVSGAADMGTFVIELNSGKNMINVNDRYIYVNGFDKEKNILKIETDNLDNIGRYWKKGTYNLKTKVCQLGKKEY
jgi:regulator of replication initiation timing